MKRIFMKNSQKAGLFETDEEVWIKFTPVWFRFLEWVVIIGVFHYLSEITHYWSIKFIVYINYIAFGMYIQSILFCVDHTHIKSKKIKRIFALLFATLIAILLLLFVTISVDQIKEYL